MSIELFHNAEEAWFWHLRVCEFVGKPRSMWPDDLTQVKRPCEPHEIFREICLAYKAHVLTKKHLEVLNRSTMDGTAELSKNDIEYFEGAMSVLQVRLERKGIVEKKEKAA